MGPAQNAIIQPGQAPPVSRPPHSQLPTVPKAASLSRVRGGPRSFAMIPFVPLPTPTPGGPQEPEAAREWQAGLLLG